MLVHKKQSLFKLMIVATLFLVCAQNANAGKITLDRILKEHKITVVTTEDRADVSKFLSAMNIKEKSIINVSESADIRKKMGKEEGLLFIIDREKARSFTELETKVLPASTNPIDPDEAFLYAVKATDRRNGWDILISAPNDKWLKFELDRLLKSDPGIMNLEDRGSILDKYKIKRMCVISTENGDIAQDWISKQCKSGEDTIDWKFFKPDEWNPEEHSNIDLLFILNREASSSKHEKVIQSLPKAMQAWMQSDQAAVELALQKETQTGRSVYCVAGPSNRQIGSALLEHKSFESIPEDIHKHPLTDMRNCGKMAVITTLTDEKSITATYDKLVNEMCGKLTSQLTSAGGFGCISRQDLRDLIISSKFAQNKDEAAAIRNKLGKDTLLAVVSINSINTNTSYVANAPVCQTERLPAFKETKPEQPKKPNPDEKPRFEGYRYDLKNGSRANDPNYVRDLLNWEEVDMPKYEKDAAQWEKDKQKYEDSRKTREMEYAVSIDSIQNVKVTGEFCIYDLGAGPDKNECKVLFTSALSSEDSRRSKFKSDLIKVNGEETQPQSATPPSSAQGVADDAIVADVLAKACQQAADDMAARTILPSDFATSSNNSAEQKKPSPAMKHLVLQETGEITLSRKPVGTGVDTAKQKASDSAYSKLLTAIKSACPNTTISVDEVRSKAVLLSSGWDDNKRVYMAKFSFEADVEINASTAELTDPKTSVKAPEPGPTVTQPIDVNIEEFTANGKSEVSPVAKTKDKNAARAKARNAAIADARINLQLSIEEKYKTAMTDKAYKSKVDAAIKKAEVTQSSIKMIGKKAIVCVVIRATIPVP